MVYLNTLLLFFIVFHEEVCGHSKAKLNKIHKTVKNISKDISHLSEDHCVEAQFIVDTCNQQLSVGADPDENFSNFQDCLSETLNSTTLCGINEDIFVIHGCPSCQTYVNNVDDCGAPTFPPPSCDFIKAEETIKCIERNVSRIPIWPPFPIYANCTKCVCPNLEYRPNWNNSCELEECSRPQAILRSGGSSESNFVEVINENGESVCILNSLRSSRTFHTMDGDTLCGGKESRKSCLKLRNGEWIEIPWELNQERYNHVSWKKSNNDIVLMGGEGSLQTSEVLTDVGSNDGFQLKYSTSDACSIQFENYVLITGGYYTLSIVSKYNEIGWLEDLPSLNDERHSHGCGHYYNSNNELVYLVVGGSNLETITSSTETFTEGSSQWIVAAATPIEGMGIRGVSLNNEIFLTGGYYNGEYSRKIYKFDDEDWIPVGQANETHAFHALSVIPFMEVEPYCNVS